MRRFDQQKENAVNELKASIGVGDVDEGIIPLLERINSLGCYYTTSSCAGRISILHDLGGKGVNRFLGKWHRKVAFREVWIVLNAKEGVAWFMYEPPILHVAARTVADADKMMTVVREAGFKHSGVQSVREGRVMLEIMDTGRIDAPVMSGGKVLVGEDYVSFLVSTANEKLEKSRLRVKRLEDMI